MLIKANDRIYLQTRNITDVNDDPKEDTLKVYFNCASQTYQKYTGQDRLDVLVALSRIANRTTDFNN